MNRIFILEKDSVYTCYFVDYDVQATSNSFINSIMLAGTHIIDGYGETPVRNDKEKQKLEKQFNAAPFKFKEKIRNHDEVFDIAVKFVKK